MKLNFAMPFACLIFSGCSPKPTAMVPDTAPSTRTIQFDDARLHVDGDDWIFVFPTEGEEAYVVGQDVAFIEEVGSHIVVNLDQTQTQKAQGEMKTSHILKNIPTNGGHRILLVTRMGTTECDITIPDPIALPALLEAVLSQTNIGQSRDH